MGHSTISSKILLKWYNLNKRNLPWRRTRDPYLIWVSEIILQQTRVNQGLSYYLVFIKEFPDVRSLAEADPEKIMKLWQGLGYYNRAINMMTAAKMVMEQFNGSFPNRYADLILLKGIGKYTAAAIASISANEPIAAIDGNVIRVLSRLYGIDYINKKKLHSTIQTLAEELLYTKNPGDYNQALMEFGALQCAPLNPKCGSCIFKMSCFAFQNNRIDSLPPKKAKPNKRVRYFHYLLLTSKEKIFVQKRDKNDIWPNLYQFPMIETKNRSTKKNIYTEFNKLLNGLYIDTSITKTTESFRHQLSHQVIEGRFYHLILNPDKKISDSKYVEIKRKELNNYAFPRPLISFLEKFKPG